MGYWVYWFKEEFSFKEKWISFFEKRIEEDIGGRVMWIEDVVEVAERYVKELQDITPGKLFERIFMLEGELTTPKDMVFIPGSGRAIKIDNPDYPFNKPKWGHFIIPKPEAVLAYLQSDKERPCRFDPPEPKPGEPFTVITPAPEYWLGGKKQRGTSIKFLSKIWGASITIKGE